MLLKLEGFKYATPLDLNMGYCHIQLCPFSRKLCTKVVPWGKYEYQKLPMGLYNSPDILVCRRTRQGIMPLPDEVESLKNIAKPTTKRQLRPFVGLINYYRDMWQHRSEILTLFSSMTSKQTK